ncbi:MAG: hypothetical protein LQ337_004514 [Flavoplaca oasis]|nr:MAG: hypothetical protein LQ337_004514 [Flavoplaca oasis]
MPRRKPYNFTSISPTNIINVSTSGGRTRSGNPQPSRPPSPALVSTSNIIDGPDTPRKTRQGTVHTSPVVRTTSTRRETRHDPLTRKDRAAHLQRTTKGRFAKKVPKTKKSTQAKGVVEDNKEDTEDEEDPLSMMDDSPSKPARTNNALGELDGNATRTAYRGPTAGQMLKALEDSLADAMENSVGEQENASRNIDEPRDVSSEKMEVAGRTPYQGPTASQMMEALDESIADAAADGNLGMHGQEKGKGIEEGDIAGNNTLENRRPTPSSSRESSPDPTTSIPPSPSPSKRILTYPNGPNMPPLITYIHPSPQILAQTPPPLHQPRSPSPVHLPRSQHDIRIPPPPTIFQIPLPLPPDSSHPGLTLQPPSRSHSPPSSPADQWTHQPAGSDTLVPREGGYRIGSIGRWPNLPEKAVERMRRQRMEVRGEMIVWKEWVMEEDDDDNDKDGDNGVKEGAKENGGNDGPLDIASDDEAKRRGEDDEGLDEGRNGMVRAWSVPSSVGDPADTSVSELDMLMEGY